MSQIVNCIYQYTRIIFTGGIFLNQIYDKAVQLYSYIYLKFQTHVLFFLIKKFLPYVDDSIVIFYSTSFTKSLRDFFVATRKMDKFVSKRIKQLSYQSL